MTSRMGTLTSRMLTKGCSFPQPESRPTPQELNDTGRALSRLIGRPTAPFGTEIGAALKQG
ncbi:hypothetical protein [Corallococcus sp. AB038B]|uniref:hypothetical protein n=1 Tax=Corallococcus sp. AB038B TaxID=2316718 RepID=UPI0018F363C5|nr:hypothetical protein [Corallococcus sp. AB038B]